MLKFTFKGGIHPPYQKELTNSCQTIRITPNSQVVIPLLQNLGAVNKPLVKKGDYVYVGQMIGQSEAFVSAPVHSSVSGTVNAIERRLHPNGKYILSIVIDDDGKYELSPDFKVAKEYDKMSKEEIIDIVKNAGIVGMGGAGFPTYIKLSPPIHNTIEHIIINGAECEPYLSSDHRAILENGEKLIEGLKIIMQVTNAKKGIIAIEDNKKDAISHLKDILNDFADIEVVEICTKYPQGSEKHIIKSILNKEVPSGKLPADIGVIVQNVDTCISIYEAVIENLPSINRKITVSGGAINTPCVVCAPIGMSVAEVIEYAGGMTDKCVKVVLGGPMMGISISDINVPVTKTVGGILCLTEDESPTITEGPCLRCGKCVDVCPMNLIPLKLSTFGRQNNVEMSVKYHAVDCIECGCCSYICPADRLLVESIRVAKHNAFTHIKKGAQDEQAKC